VERAVALPRLDAPPPLISDGWGGIDEAMVEVYGLVPEYSGRGLRPLGERTEASEKTPPTCLTSGRQPDWQYVQLVKQRVNGRVKNTRLKVSDLSDFQSAMPDVRQVGDGER
jgi:hypothetical protein